MPPTPRESDKEASAHDDQEELIVVGSTVRVSTPDTNRQTTHDDSRDAVVGEASATETSAEKRGTKRKRAERDEEVKSEEENDDVVIVEPVTAKRKVRSEERGDNTIVIKEEKVGEEPKSKRRARPAPRSGIYNAPPGSKYRLSWHEYFLDLPEYVSYDQWVGWQQCLESLI